LPGLHLTVTPNPTPDDPDAGEDQKAAAFIYAGALQCVPETKPDVGFEVG